MIEKEHVISMLKEVDEAIIQKDVLKLKDLSNQTIHSASIYQDPDNITLAVIIYSLSKLLERSEYRENKDWPKLIEGFITHVGKAITFLEKNEDEKFSTELQEIRDSIDHFSGDFKKQIQDVFQKASINKASRIYEHGISMEKTSKLLGVSLFELASYAGSTATSDVDLGITLPVSKRIKYVQDFFE